MVVLFAYYWHLCVSFGYGVLSEFFEHFLFVFVLIFASKIAKNQSENEPTVAETANTQISIVHTLEEATKSPEWNANDLFFATVDCLYRNGPI